MNEKISGLSIKLIISVLLLSVLLCCHQLYGLQALYHGVGGQSTIVPPMKTAETAKTYLDPDRLEYYLETGEIDEAYLEIQAELDALVLSTNSYHLCDPALQRLHHQHLYL